MATDEPKTDERIQDAAKFLGVSVTELKREVKEALIRQVANELAAESLKEWKATGASRPQPTLSDHFQALSEKRKTKTCLARTRGRSAHGNIQFAESSQTTR